MLEIFTLRQGNLWKLPIAGVGGLDLFQKVLLLKNSNSSRVVWLKILDRTEMYGTSRPLTLTKTDLPIA